MAGIVLWKGTDSKPRVEDGLLGRAKHATKGSSLGDLHSCTFSNYTKPKKKGEVLEDQDWEGAGERSTL